MVGGYLTCLTGRSFVAGGVHEKMRKKILNTLLSPLVYLFAFLLVRTLDGREKKDEKWVSGKKKRHNPTLNFLLVLFFAVIMIGAGTWAWTGSREALSSGCPQKRLEVCKLHIFSED